MVFIMDNLGKRFNDHVRGVLLDNHGHWRVPIICGGNEGKFSLYH